MHSFLHVIHLITQKLSYITILYFQESTTQQKILHAALKHHHFNINDIKSVPIYLNCVVIMMYIFTAHDKKRRLLLQKYVFSLESFEATL